MYNLTCIAGDAFQPLFDTLGIGINQEGILENSIALENKEQLLLRSSSLGFVITLKIRKQL
jgi:hypothetical protein